MATRTISTRLAIEGESEYKQAVTNINSSLKTMQSELVKVESEYRSNANSMAALEAKGKALADIQTEQRQKVSLLSEALANAQAEQKRHADSVADYGEKISSAQKRMDALKNSTDDTTKEQAELNAEIDKYKKEQSEAGRYQEAATKGVNKWQQSVNYAQKDLDDLNETVAKNEKYLDEAKTSTDQCATSIDQYGKEAKQAGKDSSEFGNKSENAINTLATALAAAGVAATIREIAQAMKVCVDASIAFESAVTGVYKTVSGTEEQLAAISDGIKQMATEMPATTTEIAAVAEAAGQLGIATDDVLSFSRVMLDLGESTNLSAEEAASSLAKFANITGTAAEDYSRLGSVIVGLGNNFATTEADITEMATRLASAGTLAGMTEPEIMALATAMSSVGIDAEAGGTAMTQTLTAIEAAVAKGGKGLSEFARISGMSAESFSKTWKESSVTALQSFIAGLGGLDEAGESATLVLDDMGLSGVRQSNMLKSLALSAENLGGAVSMSNQAWIENTALTDEASKRYATTESQMAMLENSLTGVQVAIGDALAPALGELAKAGTAAFSWAAEFVEENPWLVQAIAGVAAGLAVLVGGVTALMVIEKIIPILKLFNATLIANPAIAVAAAVAGLVVAIGAFAASAGSAEDSAASFNKKMNETASATDGSIKSIEEDSAAKLANLEAVKQLLPQIEELNNKSGRTQEEQAKLNALVAVANDMYPGLIGKVDELTGSYNLNSDAIYNDIEALEHRLQVEAAQDIAAEKYKAAAELRIQLADAEIALGNAIMLRDEKQADLDAKMAAGTMMQSDYDAQMGEVNGTVKDLEDSTKKLTDRIVEYDAEAGTAIKIAGDMTSANRESANQSAETAERLEEQKEASEELRETTNQLASAQDTLTTALNEQEGQGTVSLATALKLIDAGYDAALSIDTETGAISLNKEAYIQIAKAKADEQLVAIENQRASLDSAIRLKEEAYAAQYNAESYLTLAKTKKMAKALEGDADLQNFRKEIAALDAQSAALKKLKGDLDSYTFTSTAATRNASKKQKTQAEKDLADYKALKATLDHERAMADKDDLDAEKRHNDQLLELRDKFLTDAANTDEYRRATEELHKYEVDQAQAAADERTEINKQQLEDYCKVIEAAEQAYEDSISAMADTSREKLAEIQQEYDGLLAKQDAMASKLQGYGDLFTFDKNGKMKLEDIGKQIEAIERYNEVLSELKENGISDSLLNEVVGLDMDDAVTYGQKLLDMADKDDEAWKEYNTKYDEKNKEAIAVAEKFYKDQLDTVEKQYNDALETSLKELESTSFTSGQNVGQELTDGMRSKLEEVELAAKALRDAAVVDLSGLNLKGKTDGSHAGGLSYVPYNGYVAELHRGERVLTAVEAKAYIARSMPSRYEAPRQNNGQEMQTAALVNGLVGAMAQITPPSSGGVYEINVNVGGKRMASVMFDPLKEVARQRGETL